MTNTEYHGRMAVQEVLVIDEGLRKLIVRGVDESEMRQYVMRHGFQPSPNDGLQKAAAGWTSVAEIARAAWRDM
ncbi:MAG: hypothetical protein K6T83_22805 [Alicyclobacillus sp.]|nr:hypothetical protein [Alicyclobacillus sp.]